MNLKINLSTEAKEYYEYQRCATRKMSHTEAENYAYSFHKRIYEQFKEYVKPGKRCLDMGCGIGTINIFTGKFFKKIYLVDKTINRGQLKNTYYGFHGEGYKIDKDEYSVSEKDTNTNSEYCFYNDLNISKQIVQANTEKFVRILEPKQLCELPKASFDFIQSHMSWGWHYPFSQYRSIIPPLIKKGGMLIIDIRDNSLDINDLIDFKILDKLTNRESNSRKYILEKC